MDHLIKLESGDYLNLNNITTITQSSLGYWRINSINDSGIFLSPKDLEKIEKIADRHKLPITNEEYAKAWNEVAKFHSGVPKIDPEDNNRIKKLRDRLKDS